ncbi:MAG: UDP-glucose dehydrogenase family protein [Nitrospinota bacterium]
MNLCVVGLGYVGLVTAAVFADLGNEVVCVDIAQEKVDALNRGEMPLYEPGLEPMVRRNREEGRLTFTTDLAAGVRRAEIIFICVGTPPREDGQPDLSQVEAVARAIAEALDGYKIVVNKSTVPVGTGDLIARTIQEGKRAPVEFDVVSNPEFLREGRAIQDTLAPDRIVIGAPTKEVAVKLLELYRSLERPMIITDVPTAEIVKYASNTFLATKVSFINAIAELCERTGADVRVVAKAMGADARIGESFLEAGLGFGGSCFPKDAEAFAASARRLGYPFGLLEEVIRVNQERVPHLVEKIKGRLNPLSGRTLAILGLSFKPNTDDLREAKSLELIRLLRAEGASIRAYDPVAMEKARALMPEVSFCENSYQAAEGADALVVVTEWREFLQLNLERIRRLLRQPLIFDGRNIYSPDQMRRLGFEYHSVGRPPVTVQPAAPDARGGPRGR